MVLTEGEVREKTIGNFGFKNQEEKDRLNSQFAGFRTLKEVATVVSLVLIFILAWCLIG